MIKSFQFVTGFPMQFSHIAGRKFEFTPNFNVLFGNVGGCKSAMLKAIAAYCGIPTGGWSQISEPMKLGYNNVKHFPFCYRNYSPGQADALVEWDGTPSFFNDSEALSKTDSTFFFNNAAQSADGITTEAEQMDILATKPSSGQYRIHKINKIMKLIQSPVNLLQVPPYINNKELAQLEVQYIMSLPRDGKITLILDEPEKALSIPKQVELFEVLIKLSEHFQVIIATHSPFILGYKGINIIDITTGYLGEVKKLVKKHFK